MMVLKEREEKYVSKNMEIEHKKKLLEKEMIK